jgi:hypothetical protein
VNGKVSR